MKKVKILSNIQVYKSRICTLISGTSSESKVKECIPNKVTGSKGIQIINNTNQLKGSQRRGKIPGNIEVIYDKSYMELVLGRAELMVQRHIKTKKSLVGHQKYFVQGSDV